MFDAKTILDTLGLGTGGGGGSEPTGILVQPLNGGGFLLSVFCPDNSRLSVVLDGEGEVVEAIASPHDAIEDLWAVEGELRYGSNDTVG